MTPITPICDHIELPVTLLARDQPQYRILPVFVDHDAAMVSRWLLTWRERLHVLLGGSVWLTQRTFGNSFQPVKLQTTCPIDHTAL